MSHSDKEMTLDTDVMAFYSKEMASYTVAMSHSYKEMPPDTASMSFCCTEMKSDSKRMPSHNQEMELGVPKQVSSGECLRN